MKKSFLAGLAVFSASAALAQNSLTINQSGGQTSNQAVVSQSGSGNSVVINQSSNTDENNKTKDKDRKGRSDAGNQVSLRVDANTQTTINQHNSGPNSVELSQGGNSSVTINQSSGTDENTVVVQPNSVPSTHRNRSTKRHVRP